MLASIYFVPYLHMIASSDQMNHPNWGHPPLQAQRVVAIVSVDSNGTGFQALVLQHVVWSLIFPTLRAGRQSAAWRANKLIDFGSNDVQRPNFRVTEKNTFLAPKRSGGSAGCRPGRWNFPRGPRSSPCHKVEPQAGDGSDTFLGGATSAQKYVGMEMEIVCFQSLGGLVWKHPWPVVNRS